jgi:hypothetical protein
MPLTTILIILSDFHLSGSRKVLLRGQKFQIDDELRRGALNLLRIQDKISSLLASVTCQNDKKKVLV